MRDTYRFGHCELNPVRRRLLVSGRSAEVGQRAFDVLLALVERAGDLVTKDELLARAWPNLMVEENNLSQQVLALRKVIGADAIATVPSLGYRLTIPLSDGAAPDEALPSIAVLPFEDQSAEHNQEFFADGLAEEILNALARIRSLRVVSRTSAFSLRHEKRDIPSIARRLGVSWILEGSVRKSGSRIRVAAQLVRVETDSPAWSKTFDRELRDIFAVQDEIARAVVREISPSLMPEEARSSARVRVPDMEAHRLYLHGRFLAACSVPDDVAKGVRYLRSALERDPSMAAGWATLARAHATNASFAWTGQQAEEFERARMAARRSIELDPDLAEGHSALAWVQFVFDWDWRGANESIHRALELEPGNAEIVRAAAFQEATLGTLEEAVSLARRAVDLDPLNLPALRMLGLRCLDAGLLDEAERATRDALELFPYAQRTRYHLGRILAMQGRGEEALAEIKSERDTYLRIHGAPFALHALGRAEQARSARADFVNRYPDAWVGHAEIFGFMGDVDPAFAALDRALAERAIGICLIRTNAMLASLRKDPRWPAFLKRIDLA